MDRINKYIAKSGYCSRRAADELIKAGKVTVNGIITKDLSTRIDNCNDVVKVNGEILEVNDLLVYIMLHKPKGCITTTKDEHNRKTVYDYLKDINIPHLVPVGRLDYDTEGLLILTNDGDLVNYLTKSKNEIKKTYIVTLKNSINPTHIQSLRDGIEIDGKMTKKALVNLIDAKKNKGSIIRITITEGRNRQVRKMFEYFGYEIKLLKRESINNLYLGGLTRGKFKYLDQRDIQLVKGEI